MPTKQTNKNLVGVGVMMVMVLAGEEKENDAIISIINLIYYIDWIFIVIQDIFKKFEESV